MEDKHIEDIVNAYKERKDIDKFAHVASINEIKENEYNLNIPRYVDSFEEEEPVDIDKVQKNITDIKNELSQVESKMQEYMKELGL